MDENNMEEKKFTQADVDALISKTIARERSKQLSPDEIADYMDLKAKRDTYTSNAATIASVTAERDSAKSALTAANAELEQLKHERYLVSKGVSADDIDFVGFKVNKMVSDDKTFEAAADEFLSTYTSGAARVDLGGGLSGGRNHSDTPNAMMNDILRRVRK